MGDCVRLEPVGEFTCAPAARGEPAQSWARLKADDPDDVWLYNAAGPSDAEIGEHELAVAWPGDGIKRAIDNDDPDGIVAQLCDSLRGARPGARRRRAVSHRVPRELAGPQAQVVVLFVQRTRDVLTPHDAPMA